MQWPPFQSLSRATCKACCAQTSTSLCPHSTPFVLTPRRGTPPTSICRSRNLPVPHRKPPTPCLQSTSWQLAYTTFRPIIPNDSILQPSPEFATRLVDCPYPDHCRPTNRRRAAGHAAPLHSPAIHCLAVGRTAWHQRRNIGGLHGRRSDR